MKHRIRLGFVLFGMVFLSAGCGSGGDGSTDAITYAGTGTKVLEGTCEARAGHTCAGHAALFRLSNDQIELRLASNFQVDDTPGRIVCLSSRSALGNGVQLDPSTDVDLGILARYSGAQNYAVPTGQEAGRIYAWIFGRPFGEEVARWVLTTPAP